MLLNKNRKTLIIALANPRVLSLVMFSQFPRVGRMEECSSNLSESQEWVADSIERKST